MCTLPFSAGQRMHAPRQQAPKVQSLNRSMLGGVGFLRVGVSPQVDQGPDTIIEGQWV